jgi:hypothetical protein
MDLQDKGREVVGGVRGEEEGKQHRCNMPGDA